MSHPMTTTTAFDTVLIRAGHWLMRPVVRKLFNIRNHSKVPPRNVVALQKLLPRWSFTKTTTWSQSRCKWLQTTWSWQMDHWSQVWTWTYWAELSVLRSGFELLLWQEFSAVTASGANPTMNANVNEYIGTYSMEENQQRKDWQVFYWTNAVKTWRQ